MRSFNSGRVIDCLIIGWIFLQFTCHLEIHACRLLISRSESCSASLLRKSMSLQTSSPKGWMHPLDLNHFHIQFESAAWLIFLFSDTWDEMNSKKVAAVKKCSLKQQNVSDNGQSSLCPHPLSLRGEGAIFRKAFNHMACYLLISLYWCSQWFILI